MRGVARPAIAVLLLVGVGVAAGDRACPHASQTGPICALIAADDDDLRRGHAPVDVPLTPTIAVAVPRALVLSPPAPATPWLDTDPLIAAPKTSPPA